MDQYALIQLSPSAHIAFFAVNMLVCYALGTWTMMATAKLVLKRRWDAAIASDARGARLMKVMAAITAIQAVLFMSGLVALVTVFAAVLWYAKASRRDAFAAYKAEDAMRSKRGTDLECRTAKEGERT